MEPERSFTLKQKDLTLVGAIIVVAQALSGAQTSLTVQKKLESLAAEFQESQLSREQYFVRKSDLNILADKIDQLKSQISTLNQKVSTVEPVETHEEICSNHAQLFLASHD